MKQTTTLLAIMAATTLAAIEPDKKFMDALARVESNNNPKAVGDNGRAIGTFQMWRIAWDDVNAYRRDRDRKVFGYQFARNPEIARIYAHDYAELLVVRFRRATGREPSAGQLYALYNLGYAGFKRRGFKLSKCPATTQRAARKITRQMLEDNR